MPVRNERERPPFVIGPLGEKLTLETLPGPQTVHWVMRRKAEVIAAIDGGLISVDEACARYNLSLEELASWRRNFDRAGLPGLRVTRAQVYRRKFNEKEEIERKRR